MMSSVGEKVPPDRGKKPLNIQMDASTDLARTPDKSASKHHLEPPDMSQAKHSTPFPPMASMPHTYLYPL